MQGKNEADRETGYEAPIKELEVESAKLRTVQINSCLDVLFSPFFSRVNNSNNNMQRRKQQNPRPNTQAVSLSAESTLVPGRWVCCCLWSVSSLFCTLELQLLWHISAELSTADSCAGSAWLMIFASCYSLKAVCTECIVSFCWRKNTSETWEALIRSALKRGIVDTYLTYSFIQSVTYSFMHSFTKHASSPVCLDLCSSWENKDKGNDRKCVHAKEWLPYKNVIVLVKAGECKYSWAQSTDFKSWHRHYLGEIFNHCITSLSSLYIGILVL